MKKKSRRPAISKGRHPPKCCGHKGARFYFGDIRVCPACCAAEDDAFQRRVEYSLLMHNTQMLLPAEEDLLFGRLPIC